MNTATVLIVLGLYVLLCMVLVIWAVRSAEKRGQRPWQRMGDAALVIFFITATLGYGGYRLAHHNPLPTDEELIACFQTHRADIEELVKRYRFYEGKLGKHHLWEEEGNTRALMKRSGIGRVDYMGGMWFPKPYSEETAEKIKAMVGTGTLLAASHRYANTMVRMQDRRYFQYGVWLVLNDRLLVQAVFKDLYFFPEIPRIENGILLGALQGGGGRDFSYRIFASLNDYPPNWKPGECVMRQLEPQWFIKMCNG